jgi:uncharacterized delta-60 repeat protein
MAITPSAFADAPYDPTFAGGGLLPYLNLFGDNSPAYPSAIALDGDGRLLVATTFHNHATNKNEMSVTRHIAFKSVVNGVIIEGPSDGWPDVTFGTNGIASGFTSADTDSSAAAIAIDHQNRILIAGSGTGTEMCSGKSTAVTYYLVARVLNDNSVGGEPDSGFGTFGVAYFGGCDNMTSGSNGVAVDNSDRVLAIGSSWSGSTRKSTLVRWSSDGHLDAGFGTGGVATYGVDGGSTAGIAVALDSQERILVAIETASSGLIGGSLLRYTSTGVLDTSFGTGGVALLGTISSGSGIYPGHLCCVAIDTHGRALVAGVIVKNGSDSETTEQTAFIARFTTSGALDSTFGQEGFRYLRNDEIADISGLVVDHHDRVIVSGNLWTPYFPGPVASMIQLNIDGTLNKAVGFDGLYASEFGYGSWATSLVLDPSGRQTLTSVASDGSGQQVPTLIRFDGMFGDGFD